MYGEKYTVLSVQQTSTPTFDSLGTRGAPSPQAIDVGNIELEEIKLSKSEANDLRRDPRTKAIAPHMPMKLIEPVEASDTTPEEITEVTWGVNAVNAAAYQFDGNVINVAVLDTWIDPNHPAFTGVDLVQKNFTSATDDEHGHGTHCAGTIFGNEVNGTRIGIARKNTILTLLGIAQH